MSDAQVWLTPEQAAAYLQVSRRTIYAAVASGKLRAAIINGRRAQRFRREWLDEFLERSAPAIVEPR